MTASQLDEHRRYITDPVKIEAYRAALRHYVTNDTVVLDLGAGTGLLGLLAAECGAKRVYAVDSGSIISLAERVARESGHAERIVHVKELSTDLRLDEPVDLIVCDQIGGFVHDAGVLNYYADAAARLLRPGGTLIPGSFELQLTPMGGSDLAALVGDWADGAHHGFELGAFADAAANTEHRVKANEEDRLGDHGAVCSIASHSDAPFGGTVELTIERPGQFCGLLGTFVAHLAPGVQLTNLRWGDSAFRRWQNFYPVRTAIDVLPGDVVNVSIDVSPKTGTVAWRGRAMRGEEQLGRFRHDTLNGSFSGPEGILRASDKWVPQLSGRTGMARRVVELCDGHRDTGTIVVQLRDEYPAAFTTYDSAKSFVNWVLGPVTVPG